MDEEDNLPIGIISISDDGVIQGAEIDLNLDDDQSSPDSSNE